MRRRRLMALPPEERRIPFGHDEGTRLRDAATSSLESLRRWCRKREEQGGDFRDLINAIDEELSERQGMELEFD